MLKQKSQSESKSAPGVNDRNAAGITALFAAFYGALTQDEVAVHPQLARTNQFENDPIAKRAMKKAEAKEKKARKRISGGDDKPQHDLCIKYLMSEGARVDIVEVSNTSEGLALLHHAAAFNNVERTRWLLELDVEVDPRTKNNETPLMYAARRGNLKAAIVLLQHNASTDITNIEGWTALHFAALYGGTGITKLLLTSGADKEARTMLDLKTPLDLAMESGRKATAQALRVFKSAPITSGEYLDFLDYAAEANRKGLMGRTADMGVKAMHALVAGAISGAEKVGDAVGSNSSKQRAIWSEAMNEEKGITPAEADEGSVASSATTSTSGIRGLLRGVGGKRGGASRPVTAPA